MLAGLKSKFGRGEEPPPEEAKKRHNEERKAAEAAKAKEQEKALAVVSGDAPQDPDAKYDYFFTWLRVRGCLDQTEQHRHTPHTFSAFLR